MVNANHNIKMNKTLLSLVALIATFVSCGTSYDIKGTSNVKDIDGNKLYLYTFNEKEMTSIDSCEVVHGQFAFRGTVDSISVAFMPFMNISMPIMLENGDINVKLDYAKREVSGTPNNDKLYEFLKKLDKLTNELEDLDHQHYQGIMNGDDMEQLDNNLVKTSNKINEDIDKLTTSFVEENFDNVLGPAVFMILTMNNDVPMLTPWSEALWMKATSNFKNNLYVKNYYDAARHNESLINGTADPSQAAPAQDKKDEDKKDGDNEENTEEAPAPPTPNEMAQPQE